MVHNINEKEYHDQLQRWYMQDYNKNAFSFFAALCDNLQIWNRPHQYSPAEHKPPFSWFVSDVDIEIDGINIIIRCTSNDMIAHKNKLKDSLDEYLSGAKELIKLELREMRL